jgi:hypothetical protein
MVQNALINALDYNPKEVMVDCESLEVSPFSLRPVYYHASGACNSNNSGGMLIGVNNQA